MMLKSKRYPYLNCIDSQALLAQCEKKGQKDSLSALTQYLHNRKYMSAAGRKEAFSFISEEVLEKKKGNESVLDDMIRWSSTLRSSLMFRSRSQKSPSLHL